MAESRSSRPTCWGSGRELALLFKDLATLRTGAELFEMSADLRWRGPTAAFAACAERFGDDRLHERAVAAPASV